MTLLKHPIRSRGASSSPVFSAADLMTDWQMLCAQIGERRAGTREEESAAAYIAERFAAAGADRVETEPFPCRSRRGARVEVHERVGRGWKRVEATALVGAPSTPDRRAVVGELVWLELPESASRLRPGSLRGKIAAIFGPLPTSAVVHRRLVAADPLAVIHVDDRLPFSWAKNDGVYPHWIKTHGMPPTLAIPYFEGWRWRRDGVREVRVRAVIDQTDAESQNVIADFTGTDPRLPALILTAHHDTQCGNPGADDNASGVVCLLALARAFRQQTFRRTVRLISFGAEEQLSVGAAAYVRRHRISRRDAGLVINFDSVSSPLGHWNVYIAGEPALARHAQRFLAARDLHIAPLPEITPFSDHFPFSREGVPSLFFMRTNTPGGRWQHHSPHDTLENVSPEEVIRLLNAIHPFVIELAQQTRWPFPSTLPPAQQKLARQIGRELYG